MQPRAARDTWEESPNTPRSPPEPLEPEPTPPPEPHDPPAYPRYEDVPPARPMDRGRSTEPGP
jgi:hypothetical protein